MWDVCAHDHGQGAGHRYPLKGCDHVRETRSAACHPTKRALGEKRPHARPLSQDPLLTYLPGRLSHNKKPPEPSSWQKLPRPLLTQPHGLEGKSHRSSQPLSFTSCISHRVSTEMFHSLVSDCVTISVCANLNIKHIPSKFSEVSEGRGGMSDTHRAEHRAN